MPQLRFAGEAGAAADAGSSAAAAATGGAGGAGAAADAAPTLATNRAVAEPKVGQWWLLCTDEFDPESRCQDEEYYGCVEKDLGNGTFEVQDLGEEAEPEQAKLNRSMTFVYVCVW